MPRALIGSWTILLYQFQLVEDIPLTVQHYFLFFNFIKHDLRLNPLLSLGITLECAFTVAAGSNSKNNSNKNNIRPMISLDTDEEHPQTQTQIKSMCDLKEAMNAEMSFSLHTSLCCFAVNSPSLTSAPPHVKDHAPSFTGRRGASVLSAPIIEYDD